MAKVKLHLISAPWGCPAFPSIQLGALKAWVDRELDGKVEVECYSAYLSILYKTYETLSLPYYEAFNNIGEYIYQRLFQRRYLADKIPLTKEQHAEMLGHINDYLLENPRRKNVAFDDKHWDLLDRGTLAYADEEIIPRLDAEAVNVVGFTLNFNQAYASAYLSRYIAERAGSKKTVFVFGGFLATLPNILELFKKIELTGYCLFGEGERKLEALLKDFLAQKKPATRLSKKIDGIFEIGGYAADISERDDRNFASQLGVIEDLPCPDFDEYYETCARISRQDPLFKKMLTPVALIEGSRGCFAKCSFCSMNIQVKGFRKQAPETIFSRLLELKRKYGIEYFIFADNVCDTFAEKLAELVFEHTEKTGEKIFAHMNMRAHHPERFWTKLALSGVKSIQIGIEALTTPLLKLMAKGTTTLQNLKVQKYLRELGIESYSNLITHFPGSTMKDVEETARIARQVSHFDLFSTLPFDLYFGSPLFDRLPRATARGLGVKNFFPLPESMRPYSADYKHELPPEYELPLEVSNAWHAFRREMFKQTRADRPLMTVTEEKPGELKIVDHRFGRREYSLTGLRARIYSACHEGLRLEWLEKKLAAPRSQLKAHLDQLVEQELLIYVDGAYLSLALRPKSVLLKNLENQEENHSLVSAS